MFFRKRPSRRAAAPLWILGPLLALPLGTTPCAGAAPHSPPPPAPPQAPPPAPAPHARPHAAGAAAADSDPHAAATDAAHDPRYRAGLGLLNRGLHAEAATELEAFLAAIVTAPDADGVRHSSADPIVATARYALAVCYARLERLADAARELDRIPPEARFELAADAALLRAQCAMAAEQWEVAESNLAALLAAHPTFARRGVAQTLRGEALLRAGRPRDAREVLAAAVSDWTEPATAAAPESSSWRDRCDLLLANAETALGDDAAAVERLAALRQRSPRSELAAEGAMREAQALQRLSRHAECLERCAALLDAPAAPSVHAQVRSLQRRSLFALGDSALEGGDHAAAESHFARLRPLCDGAALSDTLLRLGVSIQRQGRPAEALPLYDELLKLDADPSLAAHAHFERGQALLELERLDEARTDLEQALATDVAGLAPFRTAARRQLVSLALREGRLEDAAALLSASPASPASPGAAAGASGQSPSAAKLDPGMAPDMALESGLEIDLAMDLGAAWLAAGDAARAESTFAELLRIAPEHPRQREARLRRAMALGRLGRHEEAVLAHAAIAKGDDATPVEAVGRPGDCGDGVLAAAQVELATSLLALGRRADAIAALHAALAAEPPPSLQAHAVVELARLAVEDGRHTDALAQLEQVDASIAAAILSAETRDGQRASDAPASDADAPDDTLAALRERALYLRAVAQLRSGDPGVAARTFALLRADAAPNALRGAEPQPLHRSALLLEAEALLAIGDAAAAIPLLEALVAGPTDEFVAPALLRLGEAAAAVQRWVRSDEAFTRFLELSPTHELWFQAKFGQGAAREAQGRFDAAIGAYRDVATRHQGPTAARAQFQIGECLFALKRLEDAVRELVKVDLLHASPEWSAAALTEAGRCLAELGRSSEAKSQFDDVLRRFPESRWATLAAQQRDLLAPSSLPGRAASEAAAAPEPRDAMSPRLPSASPRSPD